MDRSVTRNLDRKIDLIDTGPRFSDTDAIRLNNLFRGTDTQDMLRSVIHDGLAGDLAVVSSFGAESAVLLHLVAQVDKACPSCSLKRTSISPRLSFIAISSPKRSASPIW